MNLPLNHTPPNELCTAPFHPWEQNNDSIILTSVYPYVSPRLNSGWILISPRKYNSYNDQTYRLFGTLNSGGEQGSGNPGVMGVRSLQEAGEERVGDRIPKGA